MLKRIESYIQEYKYKWTSRRRRKLLVKRH